jgi:nitrate/TMAO reductase-like tetraheme cytochrome c subunit
MTPLPRFRHGFSRPLKIVIQLGVLGVIVAALGTIGFIEYSAQPSFCRNCHNMEPYYQSWATSSHNQVACIQCHYAPGIQAEAMGKLQAANQVVKYVTGAYGAMRPWAEIEDAACLRSGCHDLRKVEGVVDYQGVRFDHTQHLGQLRRGKQLRCTSCHSQIVQGDHVAVTPSTCYLCHFKAREGEDFAASCVACHQSPPRVVSPAGYVVDHEQLVADLVSCVSCHEQVTHGNGHAERARCVNCHNDTGLLEQYENTTLLHRVHIAERNVECMQCHTPIEHHLMDLADMTQLECAACHTGVHVDQQRMYAGTGGHGTEDAPSSMYLARVSCQGCHALSSQIRGHVAVRIAGEASCMSCHGIRYANILPAWQADLERKIGIVEDVVRQARAAGVRRGSPADSLVLLAADNVRLVREGRGAHNVTYADRLLRGALELVHRAAAAPGLSFTVPAVNLGPEMTEDSCLQCHLGAERQRVPFGSRTFDHAPHVVGASLDCVTCHSGLDQHGQTTMTAPADCAACHHASATSADCVKCHGTPGSVPTAPIQVSVGAFVHPPHIEAGLGCAFCHSTPDMNTDSVNCLTCHAMHHQPEATCNLCHQSGVKEKHDVAFAHLQCSQCHGQKVVGVNAWSRQVCTTCHVDKVDHNAPADCVLCHDIPPLTPPDSGN